MAKFYYGGQAVIEGVMMRGQKHIAVAVRAPDGTIVIHEEALNSAIYKHPVMKLPFLRGLVGLWDALGLGIKSLMFSANVALEEEETGKKPAHDATQELHGTAATTPFPAVPLAVNPTSNQAQDTQDDAKNRKSKIENRKSDASFAGATAWTTVAVSLAMMVGLFFVLPVLAANLFTSLANMQSSLAHNVTEGAIRLALFVGYIWAIGKMRDIKRVFGYHGAEHKTINAYEAGCPLTPEKVQAFTLLNPRCGTTFLLIVLLFATVVFVLIGKMPFVFMVLSRIVLVPVIAAIAYEFIRLMANLYDHAIVRAIMAPGLALQKMTTRPPDLSMLEVAIAALSSVLVADGVMQAGQSVERAEAAIETAEPAATIA
ncbi:MAG TPA: DUF1385 domain-containing protein [Chloroflexia bacterium]